MNSFFIFLSVFLFFTVAHGLQGSYLPDPTYNFNQYALYDGNCSLYYSVFLKDATGTIEYLGNPSIRKEIAVYNQNGTDASFQLRILVPIGTGIYNFVVSMLESNSVPMDIPYSCQEFPTPVIKDLGFTNPIQETSPYKYSFLVENKEKYFNTLRTALNTTEWNYSGRFKDLKTYTINLTPIVIPSINSYIGITITFPNGFIRVFDIVIPYKVLHQDIRTYLYLPSTEILTNKYALTLNYQRLSDLKVRVSSTSGETTNSFNLPVYGNPLNATCKGVFLLGAFENNLINFEISTLQSEIVDNSGSFSINYIKPLVLAPIKSYILGEQTILQGFTSTSINIEQQWQYAIYRSIAFFVEFDLIIKSPSYTPLFYLDDGSYGIVSGTIDSYKVQFNIVNSKYDIRSEVSYYFLNSLNNIAIIPSPLDLFGPIMTNISSIPMPNGFNRYFNIRFSVVDDKSGFRMLLFTSFYGNEITRSIFTNSLLKGSCIDGTYEVLVDSNFYYAVTFYIWDYASRLNIFGSTPTSEKQVASMMTSNPGGEIPLSCLNDLTSIGWSHNDIDVSSVSFSTKLLFNISNADKLFSPSLNFVGYDNLPLETFYGYWNETSEQYEIVVTIPLRAFTGVVKYNLNTKCSRASAYESPFLHSLFPSSELRVSSNDADMFGPEISKLVQIPGQTAIISAGGTNIGWKLDIYDRLNGFESGNITIVSDADLTEYTFVLDPNNQTQDISIKIKEKCVSQSYSIQR
ncbi:hypothetical protein CYY_010422, partial [Polysphondylium violaceum]